MTDFLMKLGTSPRARQVIKSLGLPIPMPQRLARPLGPGTERPLADQDVGVFTTSKSVLGAELGKVLAQAGTNSYVAGGESSLDLFRAAGEAYGRPAKGLTLEEDSQGPSFAALVCDVTHLAGPQDLRSIYDFFHPLIKKLESCGRVVVLGRPPEELDHLGAAAHGALEGFVRSVAKEIGKRGATAQLLYVSEGAEEFVAGPLRFVLGRQSAYVTGQPLRVTGSSSEAALVTTWTKPLVGQVALVTGAARGIGNATARLLASEGATVVCLDRPGDEDSLSELAREIDGGILLADVTAPDAPEVISTFLESNYGGVDIVVHNAGITRDKTLARMPEALWDQTLDVNLGAVCRITDYLLKGTLRDGGRLVFLSSIAGIAGNMGQTNYAASKSGVIGLVRALGKELADRGITANAVAPGFIETQMTAAIPFVIREVARRMNSLGQGGKPDDVAQAVNFLSSPGSAGLTGQVIRVCGGSLIGA